MIEIEKKVDGRGASLKQIKAQVQVERVKKLKSILSEMVGTTFENITALSKHVAKEFLFEHKEVIDASTLRRNKNYRRLLDRFFKKEKKSDNEMIELSEDLILADSENYQLNKELKISKETISKLLSERAATKMKSIEDRTHGHIVEFDASPCIALMKFIEHVGDFEIKRSGVFDLGQIHEVLVISPEDYPEFFTWYFKDSN